LPRYSSIQKAAEQGDAVPQLNLGIMYADGQGGPQDYAQAMSWFRKLAEQGSSDAQLNLGLMYHKGQGVPQDYVQATAWYQKAAEQRNYKAQCNLGFMYNNGCVSTRLLLITGDNAHRELSDTRPGQKVLSGYFNIHRIVSPVLLPMFKEKW
jgi:TPR repeat protein